jgi:hypothetical protein
MKTKIKILTILLVLFMSSMLFTQPASAQQGYLSYQVFYDQLSPYGLWVDNPNYGYVWIPDAGPDFAPYSTAGHWVMSEYGLTWVSDYDWGWAPFHYGRWNYDDYYGWFWVPDNEWGPAWVTWRRGNGYYGWEPMGPGISVSLSFGREYYNDNNHWIFVRDRDIDRDDINRYYVNRTDRDVIIRNSTVINNTYIDRGRNTTYVAGPPRDDVQRVTGRRIDPVTIQENDRPGQDLRNGQLRIYRPQVMNNNNQGQRPAPSRIVDMKDVRRPSERNAANQQLNSNPSNNNRQGQQQNSVDRQNAVRQQNAVNRQNAARQQNAVNQQNTERRQNTVNQQNAVRQQNGVNQQNAVRQQNGVDQQNAARQRNTVNQQNAERRQNTVNQQNAVRQQNAERQQNTVNQQKAINQQNNNAKPLQQQKVNTPQNNRRTQQQNAVKPAKNIKKEDPKKSKTEKDKTQTS